MQSTLLPVFGAPTTVRFIVSSWVLKDSVVALCILLLQTKTSAANPGVFKGSEFPSRANGWEEMIWGGLGADQAPAPGAAWRGFVL